MQNEHNAADAVAIEGTTGENGTLDDNVDIVHTEQSLSQLDVEKRKGTDFCRGLAALKIPRSIMGLDILKMKLDKARVKFDHLAETTNAQSKEAVLSILYWAK